MAVTLQIAFTIVSVCVCVCPWKKTSASRFTMDKVLTPFVVYSKIFQNSTDCTNLGCRMMGRVSLSNDTYSRTKLAQCSIDETKIQKASYADFHPTILRSRIASSFHIAFLYKTKDFHLSVYCTLRSLELDLYDWNLAIVHSSNCL